MMLGKKCCLQWKLGLKYNTFSYSSSDIFWYILGHLASNIDNREMRGNEKEKDVSKMESNGHFTHLLNSTFKYIFKYSIFGGG